MNRLKLLYASNKSVPRSLIFSLILRDLDSETNNIRELYFAEAETSYQNVFLKVS